MKLEITKASEVKVKSVEWLWYPYIPYGKVTVIQGEAGDGKSTFILKLAAMLTRGEPMPFTDGEGAEPVSVIYQSTEDDADDTIVPPLSCGWRRYRQAAVHQRKGTVSELLGRAAAGSDKADGSEAHYPRSPFRIYRGDNLDQFRKRSPQAVPSAH